MPATGSVRPRKAAGSVCATTPVDGTTSGSARRGTRNSSHSSADHCPVVMSNSRVREALEASVACRAPPVSRAIRYASTVPGGQPAVRQALPGARLVLGQPGELGGGEVRVQPQPGQLADPVLVPASRSSAQIPAVRRSCQTMARRGAASVARSQITAVSRWLVRPTQHSRRVRSAGLVVQGLAGAAQEGWPARCPRAGAPPSRAAGSTGGIPGSRGRPPGRPQ